MILNAPIMCVLYDLFYSCNLMGRYVCAKALYRSVTCEAYFDVFLKKTTNTTTLYINRSVYILSTQNVLHHTNYITTNAADWILMSSCKDHC